MLNSKQLELILSWHRNDVHVSGNQVGRRFWHYPNGAGEYATGSALCNRCLIESHPCGDASYRLSELGRHFCIWLMTKEMVLHQ